MPVSHTFPVNDALNLFSAKVWLHGQEVACAMPSKWRHVAGNNGKLALQQADGGWFTEVSAETLAYIDELLGYETGFYGDGAMYIDNDSGDR